MVRRLLTTTALVAGLALPAYAEDLVPEPAPAGTAQEAAALRAALAAYVTDVPFEKGILRVEPDPMGQRVTLDAAPFLKADLGIDVKVAPISLLVSPRADGDWNVFTGDPIAWKFDTTIADTLQSFAYSQGVQKFKGVFAPSLFAYRTAEGFARDTVSLQNEALSDSSTTVANTKLTTSARPGQAGGVDMDFRQTFTDYAQTVSFKAPPPAEGEDGSEHAEAEALANSLLINIGVKASELEAIASVKDGRNVEARDLYVLVLRNMPAFAVDQKATLAGPFGKELRAALLKLMPFWSSLDVTVSTRDAGFRSSFGALRVGEARQVTHMTGIAENAGLDTDFALKGLSIDGPFLPPWAARFVPKEAALGLSVSGVDLKTPADLAIRNADFAADEPLSEDVKARIIQSFDPARIKIALKPSTLSATDFNLHLSGEMNFVDMNPAATLNVRAEGLENTISSLQRAAEQEPDLHQVVGMIQMAQGLGRKTPDGDWEWVVDAAADGSVSVNGAVVKGPDPVVDPEADEADPEAEPNEGASDGAPSSDGAQ
ncbi:hypothetical protein NS226_15610 [Aureimonas ureilytica]|uniref:DUF2125 domain-containing protein n=1 Tax=Aureimonas ureilytica TaxID=401562 RepID=A0A175R829_9HYPH|nr:hypothetical protein [Aureimonas ureilytica]KTQ91814.1 hypothetical protein NS226_15610 [Aureimonas ureilytica]